MSSETTTFATGAVGLTVGVALVAALIVGILGLCKN
jgi:hypothetical protein